MFIASGPFLFTMSVMLTIYGNLQLFLTGHSRSQPCNTLPRLVSPRLPSPSQTKGQRLLGASHPSAATQFKTTNTLQRIHKITRNIHLTKMAQLTRDSLNVIQITEGDDEILQTVSGQHEPVSALTLKDVDLSTLSKQTLTAVVHGVRSLSITSTSHHYPHTEKYTSLLQAIARNERRKSLVSLTLGSSYDISKVAPMYLSAAALKLDTLRVEGELSKNQVKEIYLAVATSPRPLTLKTLDVPVEFMSFIPANILAAATVKLESVSLGGWLEAEHLQQILQSIENTEPHLLSVRSVRLQGHAFYGKVWNEISPGLLVSAACRLESLAMRGTHLDSSWVSQLLSTIQNSDVTLKNLDISDNKKPLDRIDFGDLGAALRTLKTIKFRNACFNEEQMIQFFENIRYNSVCTELDVSNSVCTEDDDVSYFNDLAAVPHDLLAEVVVNIERVNLEETCLGSEQVRAIYSKIRETPNIKLRELILRQHEIPELGIPALGGDSAQINIKIKINKKILQLRR